MPLARADGKHDADAAHVTITLNPDRCSIRPATRGAARDSMDANGTDCVSQNTLVGRIKVQESRGAQGSCSESPLGQEVTPE